MTNYVFSLSITLQANLKAMNAQKHQNKVSSSSSTAQSNTVSSANATSYKYKVPASVGDVNKKGAYVVTPSVLTVTNNS